MWNDETACDKLEDMRRQRLTIEFCSQKEEEDEDEYPLTTELRAMLESVGMEYTKGYYGPHGRRSHTDNVTAIWPVRGEPCQSFTVAEEDGTLFCEDGITPKMAVWMAVAASIDQRRK